MNNLNIFALGGLDENGKNMYCIEINDKIIVVNCGIKRPEGMQFGIDYIIPNFDYLKNNKDRLCGIIITHLHDDMMDALPYLLKEVDIPIYAPNVVYSYLQVSLKEFGIESFTIHEIPSVGRIEIDGIGVNTFSLTHATPGAIGISIETDNGQIVIAEQYVIDFDIQDEVFKSDIGAIAEIGKKNVLCAMIESNYAGIQGFTSPRHRATSLSRPVFEESKGRIIASIYGQNYFRIKEILDLAHEYHKRVYFKDEVFEKYIDFLRENNIYNVQSNLIIKNSEFSNDMDDCVILVTGHGTKIFTEMYKIAIGEDEKIELRETDTVIIASPVVSGTEKEASAMENELYKNNVTIVKFDSKSVLSMHPSIEDIKMLLYLVKPKYYIPVMGSYRSFVAGADIALESGFTPDRVIILDNGQIANFVDGKLKSCSNFIEEIGENLINADANKNIASSILKDREVLSTDGILIIGVAIDFKTKKVIAGPDIQSRGVIYVKDSEYLIKNIGNMVVDLIADKVANNTYSNMDTRAELRENVSKYIYRETGKRPMILPAILEINLP